MHPLDEALQGLKLWRRVSRGAPSRLQPCVSFHDACLYCNHDCKTKQFLYLSASVFNMLMLMQSNNFDHVNRRRKSGMVHCVGHSQISSGCRTQKSDGMLSRVKLAVPMLSV